LQKSNAAVKIIKIDVGSDESIQSAANEVARILGANEGLNLLVNNSGVLETVTS
jgi:NAD(P)-dependent dehydrogenase (short-subunit alcohol dehydrogenase family)